MFRSLKFLVWGAVVGGVSAATDFSVTTDGNYFWNQTDWSLVTKKYIPGQYQARISLANGYVGASLASAGPFFETDTNQTDASGTQPTNGWPLFDTRISFSTISGFWDIQANGTGTNYPWLNQYGWESFISGIPHPTSILFAFGNDKLDATVKNTTISNFESKLSFKTGVASWKYTWDPAGCGATFQVEYEAIFSRERPNVVAVKASITPSEHASGTVTDLLDGGSAARSYLNSKGLDQHSNTIFSSVHPNGLDQVTGWVVSGFNFSNDCTDHNSRSQTKGSQNETTIGQTFKINLKKGQVATFYKFVGIASTDKFPDAETTARQAQSFAQEDGWNALLAEHVAAWGKLMTNDTVDDFTDPTTGELPGDIETEVLQIASVANTFYLLQALQPDGSDLNDNSISVGGLVSDSYAGLVFWDADYWMAPGLNLAQPGFAKQISNYRVKQHTQSLANAAFNGYPNGSALYSWTAGRYGNCTGTGPCVDYEYHLNYDLAFNLFQVLNVTNNQTWFDNGPKQVVESAALMTGELLSFNETSGTWWLRNMTDPDEYANNIDNGAFTIASAAELLRLANNMRIADGLPINETWATQAANIAFPSAKSNITLEFEGMNNSAVVKQADVVLLTYPLDYGEDYTEQDKLLDLDYYANRQSPDGPAMTYSVFAIDANAISPSGCSAYTYTLNGFLPYLRAPWFQFSEQAIDDLSLNGGTNPAFPFLTGHGGANQVVPFGYLGIRTDQEVLYLNPSLPPQIHHVKVRTFYYGGATLKASMNTTHTLLTRLSTPSSLNMNDKYANTTLPFIIGTPNSPSSPHTSYSISIDQTLTLPNRLYFQNQSYANNILQCQPVTTNSSYSAGQFPVAAIDGASATRWQPSTNLSSSIIVNTTSTPPTLIKSLFFDWGTRPPVSAKVYFGNFTAAGEVAPLANEKEVDVGAITPSLPFDAVTAAASKMEVEPVVGNSTTFDVGAGIWSGGYVRLVVEGVYGGGSGAGCTVGEFVVIGS